MNAEHSALYDRIRTFVIDEPDAPLPFTDRLARENGWTRDHAKRVVEEYRKFVFLAVTAGHPVTPSDAVDQAWHLHLAYTRSYWQEFCPHVLVRSLHHQPTRGGPEEKARFVRDYVRTLDSYRRVFGACPPSDLWPAPGQRFSGATRFRRVDTRRYWLVRKPRVLALLAGTGVALGGLLFAASGCMKAGNPETVEAARVATRFSPFTLTGPQFLAFFVIAFAVVALIATALRQWFRRPADEPGPEALELDAYEAAYLAGGKEAVLNAALVSLVSTKQLTVEAAVQRLKCGQSTTSRAQLHPVERQVLQFLGSQRIASIDEVRRTFSPPPALGDRLKALGLTVADDRAGMGRFLPFLVALTVPLLGFVRVLIGHSQGKPVGYLIGLCLLGTVIALGCFGRRLHRTIRGDRALARLRAMHGSLERAVSSDVRQLSESQLARAIGLFGIAILIGGPLAALYALLGPPAATAGYGGTAGDGGDGGCGGGCGGCG
jgi:uncharacterized protein (TIGR04222 family)